MKTLTTLSIVLAMVSPALLTAQSSPNSKITADTTGNGNTRNPPGSNSKPVATAENQPGDFPMAIWKVLNDFPSNFNHITGGLVLAQGEIENYASVVELPGSTSCTITRYHSLEDTTASWQARMYQGDHFGEASRIYGELYRKLKNCSLPLPDGGLVYLKGEWTPAREEVPFTSSTLTLLTGDERYKYLKIEIEMVYQVSDWVINLNILSKKPDDVPGGS